MKEVFQFVFPGLMLMWMGFVANGAFSDIVEEYRSKSLARAVATGVTVGQIIAAKMLRCLFACWICEGLMILFTLGVFGVEWGSPLLLFTVLTAFNLFLVGFLALVYGHARSSEAAYGVVTLVILVAAVVGGSLVPFHELPGSLQAVGQWTMIRMGCYGIESIRESRDLWEVFRPSLQLAGAGLVFAGTGARTLRRRFESGRPL